MDLKRSSKILKWGSVILCIVLLCILYVWYIYYRSRSFSEIFPVSPSQIRHCMIMPGPNEDGPVSRDISAEEYQMLADLLESSTYHYMGTARGLGNVYGTLHVWTLEDDRLEIMLSPRFLLICMNGTKRPSKLYRFDSKTSSVTELFSSLLTEDDRYVLN